MKRFVYSILLLCGVSLTLAAFPVFGQEKSNDNEINKKPLQDFAASLKGKEIDWTKTFAIEVEGFLMKNGRLDAKKTKVVRTEGDAQSVEIAKRYLEALGDSGWFRYLSNQGIEKVRFSAAQTSETFSVSIISEYPTPQRANSVSSGLGMLVSAALLMEKNGVKKLGDDERKILNGTKVSVNEKNVSINTLLPASDFQEMVKRSLGESKESNTAK
jgi:hypothetical protein